MVCNDWTPTSNGTLSFGTGTTSSSLGWATAPKTILYEYTLRLLNLKENNVPQLVPVTTLPLPPPMLSGKNRILCTIDDAIELSSNINYREAILIKHAYDISALKGIKPEDVTVDIMLKKTSVIGG